MPPANDAFASAQLIAGANGTVAGNNTAATYQAGEPSVRTLPGGDELSTWFKWIATGTGTIIFDTFLTAPATWSVVNTPDTTLLIAQGSAVNALTVLDSNDDADDSPVDPSDSAYLSKVTASVVEGQTYYIRVAGYSPGDFGPFILRWIFIIPPPPAYVTLLRQNIEFSEAVLSPVTVVTRRVDIYESDGETLWHEDAALIAGSVSVDMNRDERRTLDLTLGNLDGSLRHQVDGFWYDKVIKPYRGVHTSEGDMESPLGVFAIDSIVSSTFPHVIRVTARDFTKKLLKDKLPAATQFNLGEKVEDVIRILATNGGINKFAFVNTGKRLTRDFVFESGTERWKACNDIAKAYSLELFFDVDGYMVLREFQDPVASPEIFTFSSDLSNFMSVDKRSTDSMLFNHIVVTGGTASGIPVWAEATNTNLASPSNIDRIGRRTFLFNSEFIDTYEQAHDLALSLLRVYSLEEYELNLNSAVMPWFEAGNIVVYEQPIDDDGWPSRFLLSSFTIPLTLDAMPMVAKRVTPV